MAGGFIFTGRYILVLIRARIRFLKAMGVVKPMAFFYFKF